MKSEGKRRGDGSWEGDWSKSECNFGTAASLRDILDTQEQTHEDRDNERAVCQKYY